MEVGASLVAYSEAAESRDPGQGALHDPAVSTKPLAALDAAPGDPGCDAAGSAFVPTTAVIAVSDRLAERIRVLPRVTSVFVDGGRQVGGKKETRLASFVINLVHKNARVKVSRRGTGRVSPIA